MTLVSALLLALMVPLLNAFAADRTQDLYVKRVDDATRFAVLASRALESGSTEGLQGELRRYEDVHGVKVIVTDADRQVVAASSGGIDTDRLGLERVITRTLAGNAPDQPQTAWPWVREPFVVSSPIGRDAQVLGTVVLVAPTDDVRSDVIWWLLGFVVAGVAVLATAATGVAVPLVGWIIRPVHDLDRAAHRLADGDLSTRVPDGEGPPELRRLAESFNEMADSLAISRQQQRDLVTDASHQLGNPLTALRLRVENLRRSVTEAQADDVRMALSETDRLNSIVESLLDLSVVGAADDMTKPVDVAALTRERCDMWSPMFDELCVQVPSPAIALATDGLVEVVLDALLDNAAKFAPASRVDVTVTPAPDRSVRLTVRDHGSGLDNDDIDKVGERFFRGRRHQNVTGTGLGLAIVRARVTDIGGSFLVSPASGGGLRVEVVLPAASRPLPGSSQAHLGAGPTAT